jgi:histone deacetylase 6
VLDCYLGPETFECARLAAGAAAEAAVAVARGAAPCAAAVIRPPGHHAESGLAMGFCFFNNAAVAARAAQRAGCRRVLVLDNDVHHGNGTQHIFEGDPTVLYASVHRHDGGSFFPGTGAADEVGAGAGEGFTVNVPWGGPGPGDGDYVAAFCRVLLPVAYEFAPDLVILSAGFDAALGDPLGGCRVTPAGYAHMVALLRPVAPLVVLLEGGYNLRATAESVEACVRVLAGERPPPLPRPAVPTEVGLAGVAAALAAQRRYWRCLEDAAVVPAAAVPPAVVAMDAGVAPVNGEDGEDDHHHDDEGAFGGGGGGGGGEDEEDEEEEDEGEGGEQRRRRLPTDDGGGGGVNDAPGAVAAQDRHAGGGIGDGNNVRFALTIPEAALAAQEGGGGGGGAPAGGGAAAAVGGGNGGPGSLDVGALASPPALVSPMMHLSAGAPAAVDHAMGEQPPPPPPLQQQGGSGGGGG